MENSRIFENVVLFYVWEASAVSGSRPVSALGAVAQVTVPPAGPGPSSGNEWKMPNKSSYQMKIV